MAFTRSEREKEGRLGSKLAVSVSETELGTVRVRVGFRGRVMLLVLDFLQTKMRMAKRRVTMMKLRVAAITP